MLLAKLKIYRLHKRSTASPKRCTGDEDAKTFAF